MNAKPRLKLTTDGLINLISGLGTASDKRFGNTFQYDTNFFNYPELEAAYTTNWLARRIVEAPIEDATREWRTFNHEKVNEIEEEEKRIKLQTVIQDAFKWGGLYGGAVILMITDQDLAEPMDYKRLNRGSLKRLIDIDRKYLSAFDFNYTNPSDPNFLLPNYYSVYGGGQRIHHTHVVRIPGARLPHSLRQMNGGWDDSQLRRCMEDIKDAVSTKGGIASLIQEANVDVVTREGLSDELATDFGTEAVLKRYKAAALLKSINRMLLLDGTETYDRKGANFGGLGQILGNLMEWVAGAAGIPMTRLFGVQSKGLGDSGEGDMKSYYDNIRGKQESDYRHVLEKIDKVMIRSALGDYPDKCEFEFNPLSQPSDTELAQQELAFAQADDIRLQQKVVKPSQIMRRLQSGSLYTITDEDIQKMEGYEKSEELYGADDPFAKADTDESAGGDVDPEKGAADKSKQPG
jgi:phage-related protein (TIGR01555 family)